MSEWHFITDGPKLEVMAGAGVGLMRSGCAPRTARLRMMTVADPTTRRKACRMPSTATTSTGARVTLAVAPLPQAGATIPDPRRTHGTRYSVAALLSLAVVARAGQPRRRAGECRVGRPPDPPRSARCGLSARRHPAQTTRQRRLGRRDPAAVAAAVERAFDPPRWATCARAAARAWRPVGMTD